jgi:ATP-dependent protease HslVU (ClpYQ) ATPase subunit
VEKVLEEVSFRAAELVAAGDRKITVDQAYVREKLAASLADEDLGRYIL